jgi:hypothetical protein
MDIAETYNITGFRNNFTEIIRSIAKSNKRVVVTNRHNPQAIVLPNQYKPLTEKNVNYSKWMALMFTERLLPDAPAHIKEPQVLELEGLPLSKLQILLNVDHLPVNKNIRPKIERAIGSKLLQRLEKRQKIAKAIREAESQGLYDAVEHQAGEVDFS